MIGCEAPGCVDGEWMRILGEAGGSGSIGGTAREGSAERRRGISEMMLCVSRVRAWESDPVPDARAADGELRWYLLMAHIWTCVPICNIISGASVVEMHI
jgi:hypothetical protein